MGILQTRTKCKDADPMELNFEGVEMQKWNVQTDRAQRVDQKFGVIYLFIIYSQS